MDRVEERRGNIREIWEKYPDFLDEKGRVLRDEGVEMLEEEIELCGGVEVRKSVKEG